MSRRPTVDSAVQDRLDDALDGAPVGGDSPLAAARAAVDSPEDRWYARLVAAAHDSASGSADPESVAAVGATLELVRGYCRLRADLLTALGGGCTVSFASDRSAALLAGDYLHAAAFQSLQSTSQTAAGARVETLTDALGSVRRAFSVPLTGSGAIEPSAIARTAGAVGEAAAALGASLAGAEVQSVDSLARTGRALATVDATDRLLDSAATASTGTSAIAERALRANAGRRREVAAELLRSLPDPVDAAPLRSLASRSARPAGERQ